MSSMHPRRVSRPLLSLVALVLAGLAFAGATTAAGASGKHQAKHQVQAA